MSSKLKTPDMIVCRLGLTQLSKRYWPEKGKKAEATVWDMFAVFNLSILT